MYKHEPVRRLFFAALPDFQSRVELRAYQHDLPLNTGRLVPPENLHLTLVFIGNATEEAMNCLALAAGQVEANPVQMCLNQVGVFERSRVLWVGSKKSPPALIRMAFELAELFPDCQLRVPKFGFKPHITLAHKVRGLPVDAGLPNLQWRSCGFFLLESLNSRVGIQYCTLQTYGETCCFVLPSHEV